MKNRAGKYYRKKKGNQYFGFIHYDNGVMTIEKFILSLGQTSKEIISTVFSEPFHELEEITKEQYNRIKRLAEARLKQYEL